MTRIKRSLAIALGLAGLGAWSPAVDVTAQQDPARAIHARSYRRLLIRDATVIYGNAKPAYGPVDIVVEDGRIAFVGPASARPPGAADAVIDAAGKYVMPGIVNTHMHWHQGRHPVSRADVDARGQGSGGRGAPARETHDAVGTHP